MRDIAPRIRRWLLCAVWVVVGSSTPAATLVVDPSGGGTFTDIQAAVDAAVSGDTVLVRPGE
jgi:hypothetical protein